MNAEVPPNTGRGFRARPPPGTYKRMNEGKQQLNASLAMIAEADDIDAEDTGIDIPEDDEDLFDSLPRDFTLAGIMGNEPRTLDEALRSPNAKEWQAAYDYEISQLEKLGIWEVVKLPPGAKAIPHSVVFKEKRGPNGHIKTWRAHVVAGGHKQTHGIDYNETFVAAAKMPSIRVVLANGAQQDWEMHQVDVKSAYLNAPLDKEVYMTPPAGVLKPGQEGMVCHLLKCLYGLKQAGCKWQKMLTSVFIDELEFWQSAVDH